MLNTPSAEHHANRPPMHIVPQIVGGLLCAASLTFCLAVHAQQPNPQDNNVPSLSGIPSGTGAPQQQVRHQPVDLPSSPPHGIGDVVGALKIRGFSAYRALQDISRKANIVIGVEGVMYTTDGKIGFDFPGGTVTDLLNAFVAHAPDFQWQNDNGIIHVFRNGAHVPLADVLLDYPGATDKNRREIWWALHTRPEYRDWMNSNRCRPYEQVHPQDFKFHESPVSIPAGQMTVAQLLDQVATKSGAHFWAVLQSESANPVCLVSVIAWPGLPTPP